MEFNSIPDDIWIDIFSCIDILGPAELAVLMRTCRRFYDLARKPLLRDLRWCKQHPTWRNLEAWKSVYREMMTLPRKLTISLPFDPYAKNLIAKWCCTMQYTPKYPLSRRYMSSCSTELSFHRTPTPSSALAGVPSLRSLIIQNCSFVRIHTSFAEYMQFNTCNNPPPFPFTSLPITHLALHQLHFSRDEYPHSPSESHPFYLITASSLSSLSLTWTDALAATYAVIGKQWSFNALTQLDIVMHFLKRDLVNSLVHFVQSCFSPDGVGPTISLCIEAHNLSEEQIGEVQIPLKGVWSYEGPLAVAPFPPVSHSASSSSPGWQADEEATLKIVVINEPLNLSALLRGLEKLPRSLQVLEIQIRKWDIEVLFAIRQLFPDISSLVIRYGKGVFPADFFVSLGANILFDLPNLHTLKLIADPMCIVSDPISRQLNRGAENHLVSGGIGGGYYTHTQTPALAHAPPLAWTSLNVDNFNPNDHNAMQITPTSTTTATTTRTRTTPRLEALSALNPVSARALEPEQADLKDYLVGWNRYCKKLRCVQLQLQLSGIGIGGGRGRGKGRGGDGGGSWWERRFEGDQWVEVGV